MRSTSGITCCHFFCSAVFSMPVCRKPMVGSAATTVSPSSSSTSRSTPCVLGCCGPMLTVIVSLRSSGMASLDQLAHHVQHRPVHFLNLGARQARYVHEHVHEPACLSTVASGQSDRHQAARAGHLQGLVHVCRRAAGGNPHCHVALRPDRLDLTGEHALVPVIV